MVRDLLSFMSTIVISFCLPTTLVLADETTHKLLEKCEEFVATEPDDATLWNLWNAHAVVGRFDAALVAGMKIKHVRLRSDFDQELPLMAILCGKTQWVATNFGQFDLKSDLAHAAQAIAAARSGESERAYESVEQIVDVEHRRKISCVIVEGLADHGDMDAAKDAFAQALSQSDSGTSEDLFQAALKIQHTALVREMFHRLQKKDSWTQQQTKDHIEQVGRARLFDLAFTLMENLDKNAREDLEYKFVVWADYVNDPDYDEAILRITYDESVPHFKESYAWSHAIEQHLESREFAKVGSAAEHLPRTPFSVDDLSRVSIALIKGEQTADAERLLEIALQILEDDKDEGGDHRFSNIRVLIEGYAMCGAACRLSGRDDQAQHLFQYALDLAWANEHQDRRLASHPITQVVDAYVACDQPLLARDLVIEGIQREHIAERAIAEGGRTLEPVIESLYRLHGREDALKFLVALKFPTPRILILKLVALAQLRHEGPDADFSWLTSRTKEIPLAPLYLSVADKRLEAESRSMMRLVDQCQAPPKRMLQLQPILR